ncbi:hypothetical protein Vafri_16223 [Volvox africanus]|uniref:Cyclic nucleotide-binding domain-containing protein n=1 Tax=Volvox africanus TaxID=51714 RepID=A0A8J4F9J2_9CHLO|nr:hypothetical protein Vafri_16223 [Volvox africanus]
MLAEFMANMEAFKKLPPEMIWRLASDCAHVRVPAGRVLFEEDTPGNAMYVVISGRCQVRARPLALRAKFGAGSSRSLLRPGSLGIGMTMTPRRHHTSGATGGGGGGGGGYRSMLESTPRSMLSLGSSSIAGAAAEASATGTAAALAPFGGGSGNVVRYQSDGRVATVMTLRGGERQRHGMVPGGGAGEDTDEEHTSQVTVNTGPPPVAASRSSTGSGSGSGSGISTTGKDSPFWIARFMEDALKRLHLSDSNAGLGQQMTPLAAVAAARWRQAASVPQGSAGVHADSMTAGGGGDYLGAAAVEGEEGMEALLGRAAARALRQAVSEQRTRKGQNYGMDVDGDGLNQDIASDDRAGHKRDTVGRPATAMTEAVVPPLTPPPTQSDENRRYGNAADEGRSGSTSGTTVSGASPTAMLAASVSAASAVSGAAAAAAAAAVPLPSAPPAPTLTVAVEDPAKRLFSKLGNRDPSNVSRTLLAELVQRADVGVVLYEVAKKLVKRGGGPRRINQSTSKKINRVLHHQIRAGPDHLQGALQGQKVLGRHSTITASRASSLWTKGLAAAVLSSGHHHHHQHHHQRPASRHDGRSGSGMAAAPPAAVSAATSTALGTAGSVWGESASVQLPRSSVIAPGTRPGSALTSGVSGYVDLETEFADDVSEVDWNGSDLYSLASYKPGTSVSHNNGIRRITAGDLDLNNLVHTDQHSPTELDSMYGTIIRTITPGQSFGELALLHRDSRRTASVITGAPPPSPPAPELSAHDQPVDLLCITRNTYNHTVRAAQVTQLQGLLSFLARLSPFRGLDDQQRTTLAVFCRQREVAAGTVLAMQGEPADTLWMIVEGEVVLMDSSSAVVEPLMTRPGVIRPPAARRIGSQPGFTIGGAAGDGGPDGGGGSRTLTRQLSAPESGQSSGFSTTRSVRPVVPNGRKVDGDARAAARRQRA